jgi:hypothetical protein
MTTARTARSVPTVTSLRRTNSLIDRRWRAADRVIATMRDQGQALHVSHEKPKDIWWLTNGSRVSPEIAKLVIVHPDIASVGDAPFGGTPGQTYRHI